MAQERKKVKGFLNFVIHRPQSTELTQAFRPFKRRKTRKAQHSVMAKIKKTKITNFLQKTKNALARIQTRAFLQIVVYFLAR